MFDHIPDFFSLSDDETRSVVWINPVGFKDSTAAIKILQRLGRDENNRQSLNKIIPPLFSAIVNAAGADRVLVYFDRLASTYANQVDLYRYLDENPRAIELLVVLFSSSQFLSEILLLNPEYLPWLTEHKSLYRPKRLEALFQETSAFIKNIDDINKKVDALRVFQRRELLRIGLSDLLDQFDLTSATRQLSHLADSMVRVCLQLAARQLKLPVNEAGMPLGFAVIAMGKLGGRELNYSSDIDLLFVAEKDSPAYNSLGQMLIDLLTRMTGEGFLYRVDMRLRPWGHVGVLVPAISAYLNYLRNNARLWEKQSMVKARLMAGDERIGSELLNQANDLLYNLDPDTIRTEVFAMRQMTEDFLQQKGRRWGEIKLGQGSIRDIEFVVQYLQLTNGKRQPEIRSRNTLEALRRQIKYNLLPVEEFRLLTEAYTFLRTIEHHLQMMAYRQTYTLPSDPEAISDLARRLGFGGESAGDSFIQRYEQYSAAVRRIYLKYMENPEVKPPADKRKHTVTVTRHIQRMDPSYETVFSRKDIHRHATLAQKLSMQNLVEIDAVPLEDDFWRVTIVAYDYPGELALICGLMFVYRLNIYDGNVFTYEADHTPAINNGNFKIVDVFKVKSMQHPPTRDTWVQYASDLSRLLTGMQSGLQQEAHINLAKRAAASLIGQPGDITPLYPIDLAIDNDSSEKYTVMRINAVDTLGFLYELTNALAFNRAYIARMEIETSGAHVNDILYITGPDGQKILSPTRQRELRAATVLIKHFTHLLPHSPDPESALLHFREFIAQLFRRPDWPDELSSLEQPEVLDRLARLLGVSDFLWYDFLRMQHSNLFPVLGDADSLQTVKSRQVLQTELEADLRQRDIHPPSDNGEPTWRALVNAFKDREMFRIDMRHILGQTAEFWDFSSELTDLAEVVVNAVHHHSFEDLGYTYGYPIGENNQPAEMVVVALGKCGGCELGFASDIELMFLYSGGGKTSGPQVITNHEFFEKVVESFLQAVKAKREGIFHIDLQLRPYGKAGSLSVSLESFRRYFVPGGPAWPYERQALLKLRPIAGDTNLGQEVCVLRDSFVYTGEPYDVAAMRGMRERQIRHLIKVGTFNPKYSPGGLVDIEYLVQGLQMTHGADHPSVRLTNTRNTMTALAEIGVLTSDDYTHLRKAHTFLRWLIDSLRMVAGNAKDLVVPDENTEEFAFLARRLRYGNDLLRLSSDLKMHSTYVQEVNRRLLGG